MPLSTFGRYAWGALPWVLGLALYLLLTQPSEIPVRASMEEIELECRFIRNLTGRVL